MAPHAKRPRIDSQKETRRSAKRRAEEEAEEDQFVHSTSPEVVTISGDDKDDKASPEIKEKDNEDEEQEGKAKARESRLKQGSNNTLFIRSIPYDVTPDELTTHFSFVAPVKHAHIVLDPVTKKSRGFGFVTFAEDEDAKTAVQEFNGKEFKGRALKVEIAEARHRVEHDLGDGERGEAKPKPGKEEIEKRNPRLIVRNLSWNIRKPEQLSEVFKRYGKVLDVIIPPKKGAPKGSGLLAGFAFVTMKRHRHAQKAIEEVNGMSISGRNVAVDWAVEKDKWEKVKEEGGELDVEMVDDESDSSGGEDGPQVKEEEVDQDGIDEHVDETEDKSEDEIDEEEDYDSMDEDDEDDEPVEHDNSLSLFLRNVPFSVNEQSLHAHFTENFGPVRYARLVMDWETERPRGTAFIAFYNEEHYKDCLHNAPNPPILGTKPSLLSSESQDPEGKYTIDGRVLIVAKAVNKDEAGKLADKNSSVREAALKDKRRLYLLSEGNIPSNTPMYQKLSPSERALREASIKQRKSLIQNNPSLHLSLTRLSIRNLPRSIAAKDLKFLAREAVVGFAAEVKAGKRQPLSKEELSRGGDEEKEAEAERRRKGKGVIRQVKIIEEKPGAGGGGRSRGYGFIEYVSHRWALMGLRWLNGREVGGGLELPVADIPGRREKMAGREKALAATTSAKGKLGKGRKANKTKFPELSVDPSLPQERKKRLIVEFALENAQVVHRRKETEKKWREIAKERKAKEAAGGNGIGGKGGKGRGGRDGKHGKEIRTGKREPKKGVKGEAANGTSAGSKRKRGDNDTAGAGRTSKRPAVGSDAATKKGPKSEEESKQAAANRHISKKRQMKKARK